MNNILKWYSTIMVSISTLSVFVEWVNGIDQDISMMAFFLYAPVTYFLWKIIIDEKKNK